jgi:hypothetical protein
LLPAPTAPSEGSAGIRNLVHFGLSAQPDPLSILAHQLRRRIPPNRSLFRGARPTYSTAPPEGSLVFRSSRPVLWNRSPSKPKPSSVPRPFLGNPLSRPASLTDDRRPPGAASRDRKIPLPAPLPGWPGQNPKALPNPAGGDRTFGHLPRPRAVSDPQVRPGPPSRSPMHHAPPPRVAKAKNEGLKLWITGISGTISGTFWSAPNHPARLLFGSPPLTSEACPNPPLPTTRPTCRA